jgi:hypothetical protein
MDSDEQLEAEPEGRPWLLSPQPAWISAAGGLAGSDHRLQRKPRTCSSSTVKSLSGRRTKEIGGHNIASYAKI